MLHPDSALLSIEAMCRGVGATAGSCQGAVSPTSALAPVLSSPLVSQHTAPTSSSLVLPPTTTLSPVSPPPVAISGVSPSGGPSPGSPESPPRERYGRPCVGGGRRSPPTDDSEAGSGSEEAPPPPTEASAEAAEAEPEGGRRRPARTVFSAGQMEALEREYAASRYLSTGQRRQLSRRLQLAEPTVKVWFQNRRMKEKRQQSETHMHYLSQLMQQYVCRLQWAGAPLPAAAVHAQLPLQLAAAQYAAAGAPPPAAAVTSAAAELVTSPSTCRPGRTATAHRHLFRPYAL